MALERARQEFRLDWLALLAGSGPVTDEKTPAAPFLKRAAAFLKLMLDLVDRETQDWVAEFRANLSELEKVGKAQREAVQPGTLEVVVTGQGLSRPLRRLPGAGSAGSTRRGRQGQTGAGGHT